MTTGCCPKIMKRKTYYNIISKDLFDLSIKVSIDALFYGFLVLIMSCLQTGSTTTLSF